MKIFKLILFLSIWNICAIDVSYALEIKNQEKQKDSLTKEQRQVEGLLKKSTQYQSISIDSAMYFANKARFLSLNIKDSSYILRSYYRLGQCYFYKNDLKSAIREYNKVVNIAMKLNDSTNLSIAYNAIGMTAVELDDSDKAIEYYKKALKYSIRLSEKLLLVNNIGVELNYSGKHDLAEQYFKNALIKYGTIPINKMDLNTKYALLLINNNYSVYPILPSEKRYYLERAVTIARTDSLLFFKLPLLYSNIGESYQKENQIKKALIYLEKAYTLAKELGHGNEIKKIALQLTLLHLNIGDEKLSKKYLEVTLEHLNDSVRYVSQKNIDSIAQIVYEVNGEIKKSLEFSKRYNSYLYDISQNIKNDRLLEFSKKYQTDLKIKENELLKKENLIKDLEVDKQKTTRNYLIIFSVMGLVLLGITYSKFRAKKRTALILKKQNSIINNQKIELEKSNMNKQRLFGIVSHDLINPFNAILGYTQLLQEDYDSFTEEQRKQFVETINKYATSNYNLTRTLLDWAKIQQERMVVNKTMLNCKEIVLSALEPYMVLADKKEINVSMNISDDIYFKADQNMMQTVIGNIFVNAIKFTSKGGNVALSLLKNEDETIDLKIEDNGVGMSVDQINNLFDISKATSVKGTGNEKGNGLGLILCKELMEIQGGKLVVFSQKNVGTKIDITI